MAETTPLSFEQIKEKLIGGEVLDLMRLTEQDENLDKLVENYSWGV